MTTAPDENFRYTRLGHVLRGIRDGTHGTHSRVDIGRPLLSAKNVRDGYLEVGSSESMISDEEHRGITANGYPARGDVLLTLVGTVGRVALFERDEPLAFQRSVGFLRPSRHVAPQFLAYQLQGKLFQDQLKLRTKVSAQPGVYLGDVAACGIALPSRAIQDAVVVYLDRETAEIDAFIADQEKLIELLTERRSVTISSAVQGLTRHEFSMGWLCHLPKDWQVGRLKQLAELRTGGTPSTLSSFSDETGAPWFRPEDLATNGAPSSASRMLTPAGELSMKSFPAQSTLICGIGATLGKVGWVDENGYCNQQITAATPHGLNPRFHFFALLAAREEIVRLSVGNTLPIINNERLGALMLPVPPANEQAQIAERLDRELTELDATLADAREAIALSKERRAALISAAVTGKIDVRQHGKVIA